MCKEQFIDPKQAEELFQVSSVVESSADAIIGETLDGIVLSWNPGAREIYGYSAEEIKGRSISILVPPDRRAEATQVLEEIKQGERIKRYETTHVRKDGKRIDVSLTVCPVKDAAGKITGA